MFDTNSFSDKRMLEVLRDLALASVAWWTFAVVGAAAEQKPTEDAVNAIEAIEKLGGRVWPQAPEDGRPYDLAFFGLDPAFSDDGLKEAVVHLRKLPNVQALSFNFTSVGDAGLAFLKDLPHLRMGGCTFFSGLRIDVSTPRGSPSSGR